MLENMKISNSGDPAPLAPCQKCQKLYKYIVTRLENGWLRPWIGIWVPPPPPPVISAR